MSLWLADIMPVNNGGIEVCIYQKKKDISPDMEKCAKLLHAKIENGADCQAEISEDSNFIKITFK